MREIIKKRALHLFLAIVLVLVSNLGHTGVRVNATEIESDAYILEIIRLAQDTWSEDFLLEVEFRLDDTEMIVNGEVMEINPGLDTAPYISDEGNTMLPLRVLPGYLTLKYPMIM